MDEHSQQLVEGTEQDQERASERALFARYKAAPDTQTEDALVLKYQPLVYKIVHKFRGHSENFDDLVQEGNLGLFMAVRKYDPDRGVKLSTYAAYWIRAYILKFILDNARMVRLGTTQAQRKLFFGLRKEQQKLAAQGIDATPAILADAMKVPEREVVEMDQRLRRGDHSLERQPALSG